VGYLSQEQVVYASGRSLGAGSTLIELAKQLLLLVGSQRRQLIEALLGVSNERFQQHCHMTMQAVYQRIVELTTIMMDVQGQALAGHDRKHQWVARLFNALNVMNGETLDPAFQRLINWVVLENDVVVEELLTAIDLTPALHV
jgi:enoyl reductase-like protein